MNEEYLYEDTKVNKDFKKIEQQCLIITSFLNLVLAIIEIIYFFLTNRTSILFDGIFSTIMTLTTIIALLLTFFIRRKSYNYPFGKSIYDNLFSLFKSLLLIIISGLFIVLSSIDLYDLVNDKFSYESPIDNNLLISYIVVSCAISLITMVVYVVYYSILKKSSIILKTEIKSTVFDFSISFGIGIALLISSLVSNSQFLKEVVDKSITLSLSVIMLPINLKSFFIDILIICGYRINKKEEKYLLDHLNEQAIVDIYIQKHNNQKNFMITIDLEKLKKRKLIDVKKSISSHIYEHYSNTSNLYFLIK